VLNEVQIHLIPILLGRDRRMFDLSPSLIELEIVRVIDTPRPPTSATASVGDRGLSTATGARRRMPAPAVAAAGRRARANSHATRDCPTARRVDRGVASSAMWRAHGARRTDEINARPYWMGNTADQMTRAFDTAWTGD
jgi:hypothetical protein